ncbi:MAG: flagellar assembly peptidoglycan hydrolase FlgJ [Steroidobacteraceae bacterium]
MSTPVNNASFYGDFGSLAALKRDAKTESPQALRAAAQQFESLFTNMMLKSMRSASFGDSLTGGNDVEFYQGMYDQQLAVQLSKGKGMGLADMLVQQLSRTGLASGATTAATTSSTTTTTDVAAVNDPAHRQALLNVVRSMIDQGSDADSDSSSSFDSLAALAQLNSSMPSIKSDSASSAATQNWPPASPADFVQQLMPQAQEAAKQLGVDPSMLVAHAALETGWGKHVPCAADGSSSFNLFGIKTSSEWQGKHLDATTLEYEQGVAVNKVERFKAYDSPADCFADYAQLVGGARRYSGARNAGSDSLQFAQGLQQGGYATDPQYANKLHAVAGAVQALRGVPVSAAQVSTKLADS